MVDSQHLQTTELAIEPDKADIVSHLRGALIGFLKNYLLDTNLKNKGANIPIHVQVAVGKIIR